MIDWRNVFKVLEEFIPYEAIIPGHNVDLPGIYFLEISGECIYVGTALNIHRRVLKNPHYKEFPCEVTSLIYSVPGVRKAAETAAIALLRPPKNKIWNLYGNRR